MKKLHTIFNNDQTLQSLNQKTAIKQQLQAWWQSVLPPELLHHSSASHIQNQTLFVYAHHAAAATKINFLQASLLKRLNNSPKVNVILQKSQITAIKVKVQVKSMPAIKAKRVPTLNETNAHHLNALSEHVDSDKLAAVLKKLASRAKSSKK